MANLIIYSFWNSFKETFFPEYLQGLLIHIHVIFVKIMNAAETES